MLSPVALYLADVLEDAGIPAGIAEAAAIELRRLHAQRDALLEALKWIADHDLVDTDLMIAGHMAHGFIGRARSAVSAFGGDKT